MVKVIKDNKCRRGGMGVVLLNLHERMGDPVKVVKDLCHCVT